MIECFCRTGMIILSRLDSVLICVTGKSTHIDKTIKIQLLMGIFCAKYKAICRKNKEKSPEMNKKTKNYA